MAVAESSALLGGAFTTVQQRGSGGSNGQGGKGQTSMNGVAQTSLLIIANLAGAGILVQSLKITVPETNPLTPSPCHHSRACAP